MSLISVSLTDLGLILTFWTDYTSPVLEHLFSRDKGILLKSEHLSIYLESLCIKNR